MDLEESGNFSSSARTGELLQVIARQEEEIRDLRAALYDDDVTVETYDELPDEPSADALGEVDDEWDEDWNFDDEDDGLDDFAAFGVEGERGGFLRKAVTTAVAAGLAGGLGALGKKLAARRGRGGMDVEVDLEPPHGAATDVRQDPSYLAARRARGGDVPRHGELDVEVELEQPRQAASYGRELDVEVELDRPHRRLPVSPLAGAVAAGAAALVGGLVAKLVHDRRGGSELEVEVDLEQRGHVSAPQPVTAERQYEVELERPGSDDVPLM